METYTSNGIRISVSSLYQKLHSRPAMGQYVHIYEVTIHNERSESVQLISREWFIWDSSSRTKEVRGEGVVGKQPILGPGESHTYRSWSPITTPIGHMSGYFDMISLPTQESFRAKIPTFPLVADMIQN